MNKVFLNFFFVFEAITNLSFSADECILCDSQKFITSLVYIIVYDEEIYDCFICFKNKYMFFVAVYDKCIKFIKVLTC